jgi:hypothetical protein
MRVISRMTDSVKVFVRRAASMRWRLEVGWNLCPGATNG